MPTADDAMPGGGRTVGAQLARLLVVDDNQADLDLFGEAIDELGERVDLVTAKSVQQGIERLEADRAAGTGLPDVIIMDLCMPGRDGRHLLRHLQGDDRLARLPVVVLSSSSWSKDREECLALGARHYRVKPLDWGSYLELIVFLRSIWGPRAASRRG